MRLARLAWLLILPMGTAGAQAPASPAAHTQPPPVHTRPDVRPQAASVPAPQVPPVMPVPRRRPHPQPVPRVAKQAAAAEENPTWAHTLERIAGSVVSIHVNATRAFDTEWNETAQATGFVVDAKRGLILTNRHVVTPGPVTAEATFLDQEEVQLYPVYRDPVHDFGFYRYDPSKLRFIHPKALPLYPEGAQVGREIRVVGNNAGEELSILAGTLARLDRRAPVYGIGKYNDFNTFYLQAASGTSGGSSGSPVIDIQGRVVALNAGGATGAASSFYLPLTQVRRALRLIQEGKPVTRGTLEATFVYTPYDELERLGLDAATEAAARKAHPKLTGMLVVAHVMPGSPSSGVLQAGDILIRVNGQLVATFDPLEDVLDDSVGGQVGLQLERGGKLISVRVPVGDLTAITPDQYLQFGNAIVHNLSYEQARYFNVPIRGVYVANPGYVFSSAGIARGAVITAVDSRPIRDLDDMTRAIAKLGDGDHATVRYFTISNPRSTQLRSIRMDRKWFPVERCRRDDKTGLWPCENLSAGPAPKPPRAGSTRFPHYGDARMNRLAPSLVQVHFDMPYSVSGVTERHYHGTGLIVDAKRGWVVVDRDTVPVAMGDVSITFAGTLQVPGRVVYVDPLHNLAVVAYDPKLIGATPVRAAKLVPGELKPGQPVWVIGLTGDSDLRARSTRISSVQPLYLPLSRTMRFRDTNLEVADLVNPPDDYNGVLADKHGDVVGLWATFAYDHGHQVDQENEGMPIDLVADMVKRLRSRQPLHALDVELSAMTLANARQFGLSDAWVQKLERHSPDARQALAVVRMVGGSPASKRLQQGDILLAIDGQVVTRFHEVERAVSDKDHVEVTVWRGDGARSIDVPTAVLSGKGIDRVVEWAGATLQAPHRALCAQRGVPPVGVYVAYFSYGSPASRFGLYPGRRIVDVDGVPTPNLDAFLHEVSGRADRSSLRLRTITWNGSPQVITLKLDKHYWPAYELVRTATGWQRKALE